jgi:hypothetical protein
MDLLIILIYFSIRYYKLGILKVITKVLAITIVPQALVLSIFAITRFPIGLTTTPIILLVYVASVIHLSCNIDKNKVK